MNEMIMVIILFLLGLIFGSFINALVWRLHEQLDTDGEAKKLSKKRQSEVSISKGRSMCPECGHELAARDLVPVFSWLYLRGKCRYCHKPISKQYPLIELLTGVLFAISYLAWPYGLTLKWEVLFFATWLSLLVGLIALAVYDAKWMLLPDRVLSKLFLLFFLSYVFQLALGRPINGVVDTIFGMLIGGGIFWVLFQVSNGKWIGGGDVKLGFLLGVILSSAALAFLALFFASLIGLLWVVPSLVSKKIGQTSKVPFGPFLIAGAFIAMLWGQQIIDWYTQALLGF